MPTLEHNQIFLCGDESDFELTQDIIEGQSEEADRDVQVYNLREWLIIHI